MPSILITGASRGLGKELVDVYWSRGWTVFPLVRSRADADILAARYATNSYPVIGDVGRDSTVGEIGRVLAAHTDSLDLLINNAGTIRKERGLQAATSEDLIDHFNVHCVGAWRCTKAALPFLRKSSRPVIVNITSRKGSISLAGRAEGKLIYAYQIAKAAQNMLTACLNQELRNDNITVIAIHPGGLKTSVAPPDADTDPADAARRLFERLEGLCSDGRFECLDLMTGGTVPW